MINLINYLHFFGRNKCIIYLFKNVQMQILLLWTVNKCDCCWILFSGKRHIEVFFNILQSLFLYYQSKKYLNCRQKNRDKISD